MKITIDVVQAGEDAGRCDRCKQPAYVVVSWEGEQRRGCRQHMYEATAAPLGIANAVVDTARRELESDA